MGEEGILDERERLPSLREDTSYMVFMVQSVLSSYRYFSLSFKMDWSSSFCRASFSCYKI